MINQETIRFNIVDIIHVIESSVESTNQIVNIIKSSKINKIIGNKIINIINVMTDVVKGVDEILGVLLSRSLIKKIKNEKQIENTINIIIYCFEKIDVLINSIIKTSDKYNKNFKSIKSGIENINNIIKIIRNITLSVVTTGLLAIAAITFLPILIIFTAAVLSIVSMMKFIIKKVSDKSFSKKIKTASLNISIMFGVLTLAALSILAIQTILSNINYNNILLNLILLFGVISAAVLVIFGINKIMKSFGGLKNLLKVYLSVILLFGLLIATSIALVSLQVILNEIVWNDLTINLLKLMGIIVLMGVVVALIGVSSAVVGFVLAGAAVMAVTILSIYIIATKLIELQIINEKLNENQLVGTTEEPGLINKIINIMKATSQLAWSTSGLNPLAMILLLYKFAFMTITVGLIFLLGTLLNSLANMEIKDPSTNVDIVINSIKNIISKLNSRDTIDSAGDVAEQGALISLISLLSPGLANVLESVLGLAFVITSMISVGAIFLLGKLLNAVADMEVKDPSTNVSAIIGYVKGMIKQLNSRDSINSGKDVVEQGALISLISLLSPGLANVLESVLSLYIVATSLLSVGAIFLIGKLLNVIANMEWKDPMANVTNIIGSVKAMTKQLNIRDSVNSTKDVVNQGVLTSLVSLISPGLSNVLESVLGFAFVLVSLLSVGSIFIIGKLLNSIANMEWKDPAENITNIIESIKTINRLINTSESTNSDDSKRGLLSNIISLISPGLANVVDSLLSFAFVITSIMTVGAVFVVAKLLSSISTMEYNDPKAKLETIIGTAKSISEIITRPVKQASGENGEETKMDKFKNFVGNTGIGRMIGGAVEIMKNIGSTGILASIIPNIMMLSTVVDLIKSINELVVPSDINNKVTSIIEATKLVSDQVGESSNIQSIDEDKVKVFGKYVDDSVKYFKHINKLDVSKIKSLNEMYDKMGQFMDKLQDAPIGEIADALVNKISPALSDINNNLDKQSNPTQQATQQPVVQQVPQNTQQVQQVDYTSILENIEDLLSNIKQKLNNNPQIAF